MFHVLRSNGTEIALTVHSASSDGRLYTASRVAVLLCISEASWWQGVKEGRYPQPIKLGKRTTRWRSTDIERLINVGVKAPTNLRLVRTIIYGPSNARSQSCVQRMIRTKRK